MTKGGKKDATYIAELMEDIVVKYDPDKTTARPGMSQPTVGIWRRRHQRPVASFYCKPAIKVPR